MGWRWVRVLSNVTDDGELACPYCETCLGYLRPEDEQACDAADSEQAMTDRPIDDVIRELHEALEKMTPGPWHHSASELWACVTTEPGGFGDIVVTVEGEGEHVPRHDAAGIATLRNNVPRVLKELERLQDENDELRDDSDSHWKRCYQGVDAACNELLEERAELECKLAAAEERARVAEDRAGEAEDGLHAMHLEQIRYMGERNEAQARVAELEAELGKVREQRDYWHRLHRGGHHYD